MKMIQKKEMIVLLMIWLVLSMPITQAFSISNVKADDVTQHTASISWETDEPANGFVEYGENKEQLQKIGDAKELLTHAFPLSQLKENTTYYFKVESKEVIDDNNGQLYSFETLPPDKEAPLLEVTMPTSVAGNKVDVTVKTERGATITVFVNNVNIRSSLAREEVTTISAVTIDGNKENTITVKVKDSAGNEAAFTGKVFSDNAPPKITLQKIPELIAENKIRLQGTVSEDSSMEVFVNNRSVKTVQGISLNEEIRLQEGANKIRVVAKDKAGWESDEEITVDADTVPPKVDFEFEEGSEYYEGRADTDIKGETEAGAKVFLYIYQRRGDQFRADFSRPVDIVTADKEGKFTFKDAKFPPSVFTIGRGNATRVTLVPRQVPTGLEEVLISPLDKLTQEQRKSFDVIIIAEDKTGKSGFKKRVVNVNSCFSSSSDFNIIPIPEFQAPFRLNPDLMEEGRETIQAVFNLTYRGNGIPRLNSRTNLLESPYQVQSVTFAKACTQETTGTDDYSTGCQLLPSGALTSQPNHDKTAFYVTSNLRPAKEFLQRKPDLWDDFKNRQLKMPLKVTVRYRERDANGGFGPTKTQVQCQDLGYFVDIPAEVQNFIPDALADTSIAILNETINAIEEIKPSLETAMMATGIGCVASFLTKLIAKFYRFFIAHFEPWLTKFNPTKKEEGCPFIDGQHNLLLDDTIENWQNIGVLGTSVDDNIRFSKRCPQTAKAWEMEAFLDQAYRWTCDRFLCRAVPARWTESKEEPEIKEVLQKQLQCSATSNGVYLQKIENCHEQLEKDPSAKEFLRIHKQSVVECWRDVEGNLFFVDNAKQESLNDQGIWRLSPIPTFGQVGRKAPSGDLLVYKPEGSQTYMTSVDKTCKQVCESKKGYEAVSDGFFVNGVNSCYKQEENGLKSQTDILRGEKIGAGYTNDCFIDRANPSAGLYECVCQTKVSQANVPKTKPTSREAKKKEVVNNVEVVEEWSYHQDRLYKETNGVYGTLYSKLRYYGGRDLSGAFGLDYGLDNFRDKNFTTTQVNPSTDWFGTFQAVCLPGINARLTMLQSVLQGLQGCIVEAKYTGLRDAGTCKTIFTQYFCGLIYKGIALLASSCSPLSFKDLGKGFEDPTEGGVQAFFDSGFKAIPEAIESSISEVQSDYGNAKFNQFFSTGVQGFAESICLAAFGYDFPFGMDFILDAAYSFPTATNVFFPVANRELATFDPVKGTAVYNYELAGAILPGCNFRGYKTELKCVTIEDAGNPGLSCSDQRCDCMQATGLRPESAGARTHKIDGGTSFSGVQRGKLFDLPLVSPQKVSSEFRYDHVVLDIILDQNEDPTRCFDEGYRTPNGGRFYFPISDVGPERVGTCQVDVLTGRFKCPEIASLFGGGQTYFEHPFITCFDKLNNQYVDCETPNLFIVGQGNIQVKPHLNIGKGAYCLEVADNRGLLTPLTIPIPEGTQGTYAPPLDLGPVSQEMIIGGTRATIVPAHDSDNGCGGEGRRDLHVIDYPGPAQVIQEKSFTFKYLPQGGDQYTITLPPDVDVVKPNPHHPTAQYEIDATTRELTLAGVKVLSAEDINNAVFQYQGFTFDKVLGHPTPAPGKNGQCTYRISAARTGTAAKIGSLSITAKLLQAPTSGSCFQATQLVAPSQLGRNLVSLPIRVQAETVEQTQATGIHEDFTRGDYDRVIGKAQPIVQRKESNVEHVRGLYYWIASLIMKGKGVEPYKGEIKGLLELFFDRNYNDKEILDSYDTVITNDPQFQKICTYLCEVDTEIDNKYATKCQNGCT